MWRMEHRIAKTTEWIGGRIQEEIKGNKVKAPSAMHVWEKESLCLCVSTATHENTDLDSLFPLLSVKVPRAIQKEEKNIQQIL